MPAGRTFGRRTSDARRVPPAGPRALPRNPAIRPRAPNRGIHPVERPPGMAAAALVRGAGHLADRSPLVPERPRGHARPAGNRYAGDEQRPIQSSPGTEPDPLGRRQVGGRQTHRPGRGRRTGALGGRGPLCAARTCGQPLLRHPAPRRADRADPADARPAAQQPRKGPGPATERRGDAERRRRRGSRTADREPAADTGRGLARQLPPDAGDLHRPSAGRRAAGASRRLGAPLDGVVTPRTGTVPRPTNSQRRNGWSKRRPARTSDSSRRGITAIRGWTISKA